MSDDNERKYRSKFKLLVGEIRARFSELEKNQVSFKDAKKELLDKTISLYQVVKQNDPDFHIVLLQEFNLNVFLRDVKNRKIRSRSQFIKSYRKFLGVIGKYACYSCHKVLLRFNRFKVQKYGVEKMLTLKMEPHSEVELNGKKVMLCDDCKDKLGIREE